MECIHHIFIWFSVFVCNLVSKNQLSNTITWFFLTWFPIYLVQEKGMSILKVGLVASIPALCGFAGGVLGGVFSDYLIKRGLSLTLARKLPIVLGMLLKHYSPALPPVS